MRLPYIQVTQEAFAYAKMLAPLLKCDRHRALAMVIELWAWGLDLGKPDAAPDGICAGELAEVMLAGVLDWSGDQHELARALDAVGLLERLEGGGVRVRGMDRYARTWERNHRKLRHETEKTGATPQLRRRKTGATPANTTPQTQTQTQTQIRKEKEKKLAGKQRPPPEEKHPDWQNTVKVACEVYERIRKAPYPFSGRDARALAQLYEHSPPEDFLPAWVRALEHVGYPSVSTLPELVTHLAHFLGTGQATAARYA